MKISPTRGPGAASTRSLILYPEGNLWVDVEAFEEAAVAAQRSKEPTAYRVAIDIYAGDLLPVDRCEWWAEERRVHLRKLGRFEDYVEYNLLAS